jgi:hypothetical protein
VMRFKSVHDQFPGRVRSYPSSVDNIILPDLVYQTRKETETRTGIA